MAYLVSVSARAQRDLAHIYKRIGANRCPATPENSGLRHLLYGRKPHVYRAIFRVLEKQRRVDVLHVRHGARSEFTARDLS